MARWCVERVIQYTERYKYIEQRGWPGLFESEQTPFPRTGRQFRPAAMHRTRFGTSCIVPMSYFLQQPMTDRKIEQSDGRCFGWQQLLASSVEIFISHERKK